MWPATQKQPTPARVAIARDDQSCHIQNFRYFKDTAGFQIPRRRDAVLANVFLHVSLQNCTCVCLQKV